MAGVAFVSSPGTFKFGVLELSMKVAANIRRTVALHVLDRIWKSNCVDPKKFLLFHKTCEDILFRYSSAMPQLRRKSK
jgi:hypothetical protein